MGSIPVPLVAGNPSNNYSLKIIPPETGQVDRYGLVELDLATNIPFTNPYSPQEIALEVLFTAPSGRRMVVGAFWYQEYDLETRQASVKPGWKARFTPDESGSWTAIALEPLRNVESSPITFEVAPSQRPGFVRLKSSNPA
jgi:hypothetical protein